MNTHRNINQIKRLFVKALSICIVSLYLLHPFGNQITQVIHRSSHAFMALVGHPASHHHHHTPHFALNGNHFLQSADELSKGHSHPIINFLSAAFDFQESLPDSQKRINVTLDLHLISASGQIPGSGLSSIYHHTLLPPQPVISQYYERHTPPPRLKIARV